MTIAPMVAPSRTGVTVRPLAGADLTAWDRVARRFDGFRVTHTRAWVESLAASGFGRPLYLVFERGGETVGCLPGLLVSLGGVTLFGSPLAGWQTVSMGPLFDRTRITTAELMDTLVSYLEDRHGVRHIEILHDGLDAGAMADHGFTGRPVPTCRVDLHPDRPREAFRAMKGNARQNVRRAERLGLEVEEGPSDGFVREHYEQLRQVYVQGGHAVPFTRQRVAACVDHLHRAGRLLPLAVYLPERRACVATGTFLIGGGELLLWMWAHHPAYRWYRATEVMTWTAMRAGMRAGCTSFDLMGRGRFKAKFGAAEEARKMRWTRTRPRWLGSARRVAEAGYRGQQVVRGRLARAAGSRAASRQTAPEPACVVGDVDLVRALALQGIPSVVAAPPDAPVRYSRSVRAALPWTDPWEDPARLVDTLLDFAATRPEPPVLLCQDDASLLMMSRNRRRLRGLFRFILPDAELVEQLVDKSRFQDLATRHGLPTPPAETLRPGDDGPPDVSGCDYPLLVKPLTRRPEVWEPIAGPGCKAVRVNDSAELDRLWARLAPAGLPVLVQSLVPGPEQCVESYHVYVNRDCDVVQEFTGRKLRTWPATLGESTALEITDAPDVRSSGRHVVETLGLTGVAKLDFKRGPGGRLYLLEVNPRFTLWHHPGARAGVNIPARVWADLTRGPRPPAGPARPGVRWCRPWADWPAARAAGMPFWRWAPWVLRCEAIKAFAWTDPAPLLRAGLARAAARATRIGGHEPPAVPAGTVAPGFVAGRGE